jgi:enoyl-CoA hydratase
MTDETLRFELRDGIAVVTVNRPAKLNALNDQVMAALGRAAKRIAGDDGVRGVIVTGAGEKAFVAGADIEELAAQGPFDGKARALRGHAVFRSLETCGKPVVAAINGYALGRLLAGELFDCNRPAVSTLGLDM